MSEIERVPLEVSGLHDAVELRANASVAFLKCDKNGTPVKLRKTPELHPCNVMASYEDGTLTVSVREIGVMVSIRLDEAMAVIREAAKAALDAADCQPPAKEELDVKANAATQG